MVEPYNWARNKLQQVQVMMARNPELWSLFVALVLSGIVSRMDNTSSNGATFVVTVPPRIFSNDSLVREFPTGDMIGVKDLILDTGAEVWVIMYYAHWDANSLETGKELEKAAQQLADEVLFIAVNCWYPLGGCRQKVTVPYFPIIFAHRDRNEGIQYTGLQYMPEIVNFLTRVCTPVMYVPDLETLRLMRAEHDTVAVVYFSYANTLTPPGLASYQWAAMLHVEKDPIQPIPFGIITSKSLAGGLGMTHSKNFTLLRSFNASLFYPPNEDFKARPLANWVNTHREKLVQWIAPPSLKSTILSSQITQGPTLLMFTPHQYHQGFSNSFQLLREIALQYHNCNNNSFIQDLVKIIQENRRQTMLQADDETCDIGDDECGDSQTVCSDRCQTLASKGKIESITTVRGNVCEICETFDDPLSIPDKPCSPVTLGSSTAFLLQIGNSVTASSNACLHITNFYSPYSHFRLCCQDMDASDCNSCTPFYNHQKQSCLENPMCRSTTQSSSSSCICCNNSKYHTGSDQSQSSKYPFTNYKCRTAAYDSNIELCQEKSSKITISIETRYFERSFDSDFHEFEGLRCRTDRTVNFYAIRSEYFWVMAERLGIQSTPSGQDVGIAIVDIENETHHILPLDEDGLTSSVLKQFIVNYTLSLLRRHQQSSTPSVPPLESHVGCTPVAGTICITEVSANTFDDIVLSGMKDVLLLYYTPWCGACLRLHHTYLQLASLFQPYSNLTLARINPDSNDLPWQFIAPAYPTILFFPAGSKADSIRFPEDRPVTLPNLVEFVLQHSQAI